MNALVPLRQPVTGIALGQAVAAALQAMAEDRVALAMQWPSDGMCRKSLLALLRATLERVAERGALLFRMPEGILLLNLPVAEWPALHASLLALFTATSMTAVEAAAPPDAEDPDLRPSRRRADRRVARDGERPAEPVDHSPVAGDGQGPAGQSAPELRQPALRQPAFRQPAAPFLESRLPANGPSSDASRPDMPHNGVAPAAGSKEAARLVDVGYPVALYRLPRDQAVLRRFAEHAAGLLPDCPGMFDLALLEARLARPNFASLVTRSPVVQLRRGAPSPAALCVQFSRIALEDVLGPELDDGVLLEHAALQLSSHLAVAAAALARRDLAVMLRWPAGAPLPAAQLNSNGACHLLLDVCELADATSFFQRLDAIRALGWQPGLHGVDAHRQAVLHVPSVPVPVVHFSAQAGLPRDFEVSAELRRRVVMGDCETPQSLEQAAAQGFDQFEGAAATLWLREAPRLG